MRCVHLTRVGGEASSDLLCHIRIVLQHGVTTVRQGGCILVGLNSDFSGNQGQTTEGIQALEFSTLAPSEKRGKQRTMLQRWLHPPILERGSVWLI